MRVIVIREAFVDSPDNVVAGGYDDVERVIGALYPGAVLDGAGGFDTPDGGSYMYDVTGVRTV